MTEGGFVPSCPGHPGRVKHQHWKGKTGGVEGGMAHSWDRWDKASLTISFLSDPQHEAEVSSAFCMESIPARGRAFPAGDRRRKEPLARGRVLSWGDASSSGMPDRNKRRGWQGPGSSQHKHKPHCGLVSHPHSSGNSRRHSLATGVGLVLVAPAWGSPLAPMREGN